MKGSELYDKLKEIKHRIVDCDNKAIDLGRKLGKELGIEPKGISVHGSHHAIGGGISGIELPFKPEGWRKVYANHTDKCFLPAKRKVNQAVLAEIDALPVVREAELNTLLGYHHNMRRDNRVLFHPSINWSNDEDGIVLISFAEYVVGYKPVEGMIEIMVSEYRELLDKILKKRKQKKEVCND